MLLTHTPAHHEVGEVSQAIHEGPPKDRSQLVIAAVPRGRVCSGGLLDGEHLNTVGDTVTVKQSDSHHLYVCRIA